MLASADDLQSRVAAVLADGGIELHRELPSTGTIRIPDADKRPSNRSCAVTVLDDRVLIYGHASGYAPPAVFKEDRRTTRIDPATRAWHRVQAAKERAKAQAAQDERRRLGTLDARTAWRAATPCTDHLYMTAKGETLPGCRVDADGWLLVPRIDIDDNLIGLQRIDATGTKRYWPGAPTAGTFYLQGMITTGGTVIVCEGAATGGTLRRETEHAVACAMDCGNMMGVCRALRARYPRADIVVAGDDDRGTPCNPGRTKALQAAEAVDGLVWLPEFCAACDRHCSDHNDVAACRRRA